MRHLVVLLLMVLIASCGQRDNFVLDLAGEWQFQMDSADRGMDESWYAGELGERMVLPGSLMEAGIGHEITLETQWTGSIYDSSWFFNPHTEPYRQPGNLMFPFWLTPDVYYVGAAWYQKEVEVPNNWMNGESFFI